MEVFLVVCSRCGTPFKPGENQWTVNRLGQHVHACKDGVVGEKEEMLEAAADKLAQRFKMALGIDRAVTADGEYKVSLKRLIEGARIHFPSFSRSVTSSNAPDDASCRLAQAIRLLAPYFNTVGIRYTPDGGISSIVLATGPGELTEILKTTALASMKTVDPYAIRER